MKVTAVAALALLTSTAAQPSRPVIPDSISYQAGPCMGGCPIYKVEVRSDGTATFEGVNFTAVTGVREFRITPAQYRAFARHLAPVRPRGIVSYNGENCREMVTDASSVNVIWADRRGAAALHFYHGCDPARNRAMARRLISAPTLLPIGDYIGRNR
jgi:hypothetical protein